MTSHGEKKYAVILAFDVKVTDEARREAKNQDVTIFNADIIYHLQDQFSKYCEGVRLGGALYT